MREMTFNSSKMTKSLAAWYQNEMCLMLPGFKNCGLFQHLRFVYVTMVTKVMLEQIWWDKQLQWHSIGHRATQHF